MSIRPATYFEAWCDGTDPPHRIVLGDYIAMEDEEQIRESVTDSEGYLHPDGRVFCSWEHIPTGFCHATDNGVHEYEGEEPECVVCGRN